MRKLFTWCSAALVATGLGWAVFQGYQHPESFYGRFLVKSCQVGMQCNPVFSVHKPTTDQALGLAPANSPGLMDAAGLFEPLGEDLSLLGKLPMPIHITEEVPLRPVALEIEPPLAEKPTAPVMHLADGVAGISSDIEVIPNKTRTPRIMPLCPESGQECPQRMPLAEDTGENQSFNMQGANPNGCLYLQTISGWGCNSRPDMHQCPEFQAYFPSKPLPGGLGEEEEEAAPQESSPAMPQLLPAVPSRKEIFQPQWLPTPVESLPSMLQRLRFHPDRCEPSTRPDTMEFRRGDSQVPSGVDPF